MGVKFTLYVIVAFSRSLGLGRCVFAIMLH